MKNLLSNTQFGVYLNTFNFIFDSEYRFLRSNYDSFLLRKSEIWMFVPCKLIKGIWVILEKPKEHLENRSLYFKELDEYQEATERILFEGFAYVNKVMFHPNSDQPMSIEKFECYFCSKTVIEDLGEDMFDYVLTKTALKEIGIFNYCKE